MQEYYFLFALGFVCTIFATLQDMKTREVANWLNFSLIAFALSYRAFYSIANKNPSFFLLGLAGFALFFLFAYALYYTKAFAGGDAKLLMGFGAILPFENFKTLIPSALLFIFLLFLVGALYGLAYSASILTKNKKQFKNEIEKISQKYKLFLLLSFFLFLIFLILSSYNARILIVAFLFLIPFVYVYTKALDKCMTKLVPANKLTEGDWLEKDIRINKKITIKKTVHGLSFKDIKILKKFKRSVLIKEGIPFTPSFLIALLITVFFALNGGFSLDALLSYFF